MDRRQAWRTHPHGDQQNHHQHRSTSLERDNGDLINHVHQSSGTLDNRTQSYWTGTRVNHGSSPVEDDDVHWINNPRWIKRQIHLPSASMRHGHRLGMCSDTSQDHCQQSTTSENDDRPIQYSLLSRNPHLYTTVEDRQRSNVVMINSRTDPHNVCFSRPPPPGTISKFLASSGNISETLVAGDDGGVRGEGKVNGRASKEVVYRTQTEPTVRVEFTTDNNGNLIKVIHPVRGVARSKKWGGQYDWG